MRHLQCQESQVFRHITSYPRMAMSLLGKSPKTDTLFPKTKIPKNGKTGISFLGNRNPHFTGTPKTKSPKTSSKNGFGEILPVQGQPRLSSKGNLAYPLTISPKNKTEAKYTGNMPLWFKPYWHLIPLNPFIFKAFSLHPSNLKWPHRKESSSLQGHSNLLYSLFGAAPDCPHRIIGCASG